jgi:hypothetical protein
MAAVTLAHLISTGNDITAWCLDCQHHADLKALELAVALGEDFPVLTLSGRRLLRCKRCGSRNTTTRLANPRAPFSAGWKDRPRS